jgi:hypothetical protein
MTISTKTTGAALNRYKSVQEVQTDPELIRAVVARYGRIGFDLAASKANSQAGDSFFSKADDALARDWSGLRAETLWLNCEFNAIAPWAAKCHEEVDKMHRKWRRLLLLTPASIGANWFRDHIHQHAYVQALNGRPTFVGSTQPYPKDCMISCYDGTTGFGVWRWNAGQGE